MANRIGVGNVNVIASFYHQITISYFSDNISVFVICVYGSIFRRHQRLLYAGLQVVSSMCQGS